MGDGGAADGGACTTCGESCVDLETDPQNCGACDHSCAGAACEAGTCRALRLSGAPFSGGTILGQDLSSLYIAGYGEEIIYRCPKAGCADPTDIVVDSPEALHTTWLGAEGANLYWLTYEGKLWRCQSDTCDTPSLVWEFGSNHVQDVAMNSSGIYLATLSGIACCELGSCGDGPVSIYPDAVSHLALRGGTLVFNALVDGVWVWQLLTCETPHCERPELVGEPIEVNWSLALSDAQIYWWGKSSGTSARYAVYSCPKSGCDPSPLSVSVLNDSPTVLAASGLGAFYTSAYENQLWGWSETLQDRRSFEPTLYISSNLLADDQFVFFVDDLGYLYRLAPW